MSKNKKGNFVIAGSPLAARQAATWQSRRKCTSANARNGGIPVNL